ncbi:MAG: hypothetical protein Q9168_006716 [Polycauliona sp. 1 TL-2023]
MPEGRTGWSEAEKLALMVSIVHSLGTAPKWDQVKLPEGRSKMACIHAYRGAMEAAKTVTLGDNQNADAVKKRSRKNQTSKTTTGGKGKRARNHEEDQGSDASEGEKPEVKRVKTEAEKVKTEDEGVEV